jgi:hypothetical protein
MFNAVFALLLLLLPPNLIGEWRAAGEDGQEVLTLRAGGAGELDGMRLAWRVEGETLIVRFEAVPVDVPYKFRQSGDVLVLKDQEGEEATFRRTGGAPAEPAPAPPPAPAPAPAPAAPSEPAKPAGEVAPALPAGKVATTGKAHEHPRGFSIELPEGWTATNAANGFLVAPPDLAQGVETYAVASTPLAPYKSVRDPAAIAGFDKEMAGLAPFLARQGEPETIDPDGVRVRYEGANPEGKVVLGLAAARTLGTNSIVVFAIGFKEKVLPRDPALRAIYASIQAVEPKAGGTDWLVGLWNANEKISSLTTRNRDVTFNADGSFTYLYLFTRNQSGGSGNFYAQQISRAGRWSVADGNLTMTFDPSRDKFEWPPEAGDPHREPQWVLPLPTPGMDGQGRTIMTGANGDVWVKQR